MLLRFVQIAWFGWVLFCGAGGWGVVGTPDDDRDDIDVMVVNSGMPEISPLDAHRKVDFVSTSVVSSIVAKLELARAPLSLAEGNSMSPGAELVGTCRSNR